MGFENQKNSPKNNVKWKKKVKKTHEKPRKKTFIDFETKMCRSRGLGASIAAFCPVDPSSNPLQT